MTLPSTQLLLVALLLTLTACGGGEPLKPVPALVEEAYQWNQRAESAFRRGDLDVALESSQRALALYRSLEDSEGVTRELANLSSIHLARGEPDKAVSVLEPILAGGGTPFRPQHRAEAAYRIAAIEATRDRESAGRWLDRAETECQSDCAALGRMLNLRARLLLGSQRTSEAQALARRALALNDKRHDRQESANSLRLLGELALARKQPTEARDYFQKALAIDKDEAVPNKIYADLMGIGRSYSLAGNSRQGAEYYRRARAVARAAGDQSGVAEADRQLNAGQ